MGDLKDPRLIYLKGFLFLLAGAMAAATLLIECGSLRVGFLLFVTV